MERRFFFDFSPPDSRRHPARPVPPVWRSVSCPCGSFLGLLVSSRKYAETLLPRSARFARRRKNPLNRRPMLQINAIAAALLVLATVRALHLFHCRLGYVGRLAVGALGFFAF